MMTYNTTNKRQLSRLMKSTRIALLVLIVWAGAATTSLAQQGDPDSPRKERIERLKRAFITDKLDLTVEEAEKFWPVYNAYARKRETLRMEMKRTQRAIANDEGDLNASIDQLAAKRIEDVRNDQQLAKDALPILGKQKTTRLLGLEQEFRREMMQRLKERKQEGR
jgi:uncharacterized membrane protein YgaE (UPF0421/DUF939 family)